LVYELDHSQAYKRFAENAYIIKNFNLKPGGSVAFVRNIPVVAESLGPFCHDRKLKVGDICHHMYYPTNLPPKGNESMEKYDAMEDPEFHMRGIKELKEELFQSSRNMVKSKKATSDSKLV